MKRERGLTIRDDPRCAEGVCEGDVWPAQASVQDANCQAAVAAMCQGERNRGLSTAYIVERWLATWSPESPERRMAVTTNRYRLTIHRLTTFL